MDELTAVECRRVLEHTTGQLTDKRDGKTYWVTKLKDGNCWMTQNLDYNGGGKEIYNVSDWKTSTGEVSTTIAAYYDPGDITYGNYYTYVAATQACPSNWRLPTGNTDGEFQSLLAMYGISSESTDSKALREAPLNFQRSGIIAYNGVLDYADTRGCYWSSTVVDSAQAYYLAFSSSFVNPSSTAGRFTGQSIRCLVSGS